SLVVSYSVFHCTATTEIYTLSLHDALPIYERGGKAQCGHARRAAAAGARGRRLHGNPARPVGRSGGSRSRAGARPAGAGGRTGRDRKSTRLNSSHVKISYAVFCLKKKTKDE